MAATIEVTCPTCGKGIKVPPDIIGKLIRCKGCQSPFEAIDPKAAKPVVPAKPIAAKPAKPVAAKPVTPAGAIPFKEDPPPPAPSIPLKPIDDDDDDNPNPYGVTIESDVPRCPFCAKELDPPDTLICLNCGYDLHARKRHQTKAVYELQNEDYIKHWLPAILCILVFLFVLSCAGFTSFKMNSWLTGTLLDSDEKDPITGKTKFYVPPFCFNVWIWIFTIFISFQCLRFAIRRLIINWRPPETVKKK